MQTLSILIAKSGVSLLDLLPHKWEVVIADYSRLDQRSVEWWSRPSCQRYEEIIILDRNVTTALTQRKLEKELRLMGIEGSVRYAGNPKTLLGYRHLDYLLTKEGLVPKPEIEPPSDVYRLNRYMIALVGLPAAGKTLLRHLFSRWENCSVYKWSKYLLATVEQYFGPMTSFDDVWDKVVRFTDEVEAQDRVAVARTFLERSTIQQDPATFAVIDGIKSREQIIYVSYALRRPVIIVEVRREEAERQAETLKRGDPDDFRDAERLEILRRMGALDVIDFADFVVETTDCATVYDDSKRTCQVRFTERFIAGIHEILSWIFVSDSLEATKELVCRASREVAEARGYAASVEIVEGGN